MFFHECPIVSAKSIALKEIWQYATEAVKILGSAKTIMTGEYVYRDSVSVSPYVLKTRSDRNVAEWVAESENNYAWMYKFALESNAACHRLNGYGPKIDIYGSPKMLNKIRTDVICDISKIRVPNYINSPDMAVHKEKYIKNNNMEYMCSRQNGQLTYYQLTPPFMLTDEEEVYSNRYAICLLATTDKLDTFRTEIASLRSKATPIKNWYRALKEITSNPCLPIFYQEDKGAVLKAMSYICSSTINSDPNSIPFVFPSYMEVDFQ